MAAATKSLARGKLKVSSYFGIGAFLVLIVQTYTALKVSYDNLETQRDRKVAACSTKSFALASRQSYGFFDDISDATWKRMQAKARNFVQYTNREEPKRGSAEQIKEQKVWYENNLQPDFTCPHVQRVGGHGDGPKWTCDPHRLLKRKDCLVYSIGSNGNYLFEDSLVEILVGHPCEIHVFDPDDYARPNDPKKKNIHFHQWALGNGEENPSEPRAKSFPEILQALGHENRTIDILKIDCESCEWTTYKDWISRDIRQVLIETHGVPQGAVAFFDSFKANHFALFSKESNAYCNGLCMEFSFVKLHPDFWKESL